MHWADFLPCLVSSPVLSPTAHSGPFLALPRASGPVSACHATQLRRPESRQLSVPNSTVRAMPRYRVGR